jgi:hypothetical protein
MIRIITFLSVLILGYLSGCFCNASFNLIDWGNAGRLSTAILSLMCAFIISTFPDLKEYIK